MDLAKPPRLGLMDQEIAASDEASGSGRTLPSGRAAPEAGSQEAGLAAGAQSRGAQHGGARGGAAAPGTTGVGRQKRAAPAAAPRSSPSARVSGSGSSPKRDSPEDRKRPMAPFLSGCLQSWRAQQKAGRGGPEWEWGGRKREKKGGQGAAASREPTSGGVMSVVGRAPDPLRAFGCMLQYFSLVELILCQRVCKTMRELLQDYIRYHRAVLDLDSLWDCVLNPLPPQMVPLIQSMHRVSRASLAWCHGVQNDELVLLLQAARENNQTVIRSLDLRHCYDLTAGGLRRAIAECPRVEELCLASLPALTDKLMSAIAGLRKLKRLDVSCSGLTGDAWAAFRQKNAFTKLKTLRLCKCPNERDLRSANELKGDCNEDGDGKMWINAEFQRPADQGQQLRFEVVLRNPQKIKGLGDVRR